MVSLPVIACFVFGIALAAAMHKVFAQKRILILMEHVIEHERQCYDLAAKAMGTEPFPKGPISRIVLEDQSPFTPEEYRLAKWPEAK